VADRGKQKAHSRNETKSIDSTSDSLKTGESSSIYGLDGVSIAVGGGKVSGRRISCAAAALK
jgi:hypothetical protein